MLRRRSPFTNDEWRIGRRSGFFCATGKSIRSTCPVRGRPGKTIGVVGIDRDTALTGLMDIDLIQALHGRAPSVATGAKRMRPDCLVFTLQGDGDRVNEGLQEVIHTAARGESVTCILLDNGVFGETGGHMTATTVLGQRTTNTIDGRDAQRDGYPILISEMLAQLQGTTYVARGSVHDANGVARVRRFLDLQLGAIHEVGEVKEDGVLIERTGR